MVFRYGRKRASRRRFNRRNSRYGRKSMVFRRNPRRVRTKYKKLKTDQLVIRQSGRPYAKSTRGYFKVNRGDLFCTPGIRWDSMPETGFESCLDTGWTHLNPIMRKLGGQSFPLCPVAGHSMVCAYRCQADGGHVDPPTNTGPHGLGTAVTGLHWPATSLADEGFSDSYCQFLQDLNHQDTPGTSTDYVKADGTVMHLTTIPERPSFNVESLASTTTLADELAIKAAQNYDFEGARRSNRLMFRGVRIRFRAYLTDAYVAAADASQHHQVFQFRVRLLATRRKWHGPAAFWNEYFDKGSSNTTLDPRVFALRNPTLNVAGEVNLHQNWKFKKYYLNKQTNNPDETLHDPSLHRVPRMQTLKAAYPYTYSKVLRSHTFTLSSSSQDPYHRDQVIDWNVPLNWLLKYAPMRSGGFLNEPEGSNVGTTNAYYCGGDRHYGTDQNYHGRALMLLIDNPYYGGLGYEDVSPTQDPVFDSRMSTPSGNTVWGTNDPDNDSNPSARYFDGAVQFFVQGCRYFYDLQGDDPNETAKTTTAVS